VDLEPWPSWAFLGVAPGALPCDLHRGRFSTHDNTVIDLRVPQALVVPPAKAGPVWGAY
jgi:hypothetical protein